jgi:hypothetical protein
MYTLFIETNKFIPNNYTNHSNIYQLIFPIEAFLSEVLCSSNIPLFLLQ